MTGPPPAESGPAPEPVGEPEHPADELEHPAGETERSADATDQPADETPPPGRRKKKKRMFGVLPRPVWQVGRLLILALLIEYLVLPQLAGPRKLLTLLTQVNPLLLLAGVALEAGALLAYAELTRAVLPPANRPGLFTVFRIQMTTLSVSHCAPGGSAAGTALGYRLLTQFGVETTEAGFALGVQGIGSAVVLNLLLWLALVISIPAWGFTPEYLLAAVVGGILLTAAAVLVYALTRGEDRVGAMLEKAADRVPFVDGPALRRSYGQLAEQLAGLAERRESMIRALVWAVLNWLLDAASLLVFVGAFGHWVNPDGLLVAYGLANVLAAIPLTPGGLGVVEATLTTLLVGFGTTRGVATLGVVVYRLFQFWAPIPLGGLTYLSLQATRHHNARLLRKGQINSMNMPFGADEPHPQAH